MARKKKLQRLIKKVIGSPDLDQDILNLLQKLEENHETFDSFDKQLLKKLPLLFDAVEDSFKHSESNLQLARSNLKLSTEELSEKHIQLIELNHTIQTMLKNLDQGYFIFDKEGRCLPVFSERTIDLFKKDPTGKEISEILRGKNNEDYNFENWIKLISSDEFDSDDILPLGPELYHDGERYISLNYKAMLDSKKLLLGVIVIATDITVEYKSKDKIDEITKYSQMILNYFNSSEEFSVFFKYVDDVILELESWDLGSVDSEKLFRVIHTLKGTASTLSIWDFEKFSHAKEDQLDQLIKTTPASTLSKELLNFIQIFTQEVKDLKFNVLRKYKKLFSREVSDGKVYRRIYVESIESFKKKLSKEIKESNKSSDILNSFEQHFERVPIESCFSLIDSRLTSLAEKQGKMISFSMHSNKEIFVFEKDYNSLFKSLQHLFVNSVCHGIEAPHDRVSFGKEEIGQIRLNFELKDHSNEIKIILSDDGKGINVSEIKEKLREKDIEVSDEESLIEHIFNPGFSLAEEITSDAGRGIGMDDVKREVEDMGGNISISTELGSGTTFNITIPYI